MWRLRRSISTFLYKLLFIFALKLWIAFSLQLKQPAFGMFVSERLNLWPNRYRKSSKQNNCQFVVPLAQRWKNRGYTECILKNIERIKTYHNRPCRIAFVDAPAYSWQVKSPQNTRWWTELVKAAFLSLNLVHLLFTRKSLLKLWASIDPRRLLYHFAMATTPPLLR